MSFGSRLVPLCAGLVVVVLGISTWLTLEQSRRAIGAELRSSVDLAAVLLEGLLNERPPFDPRGVAALVSKVRARHLDIQVTAAHAPPDVVARVPADVPGWFIARVAPEPAGVRRLVPVPGTDLAIAVSADPHDELVESWRESRRIIAGLSLLAGGLAAVFLLWWRALRRAIARATTGLGDVASEHVSSRPGPLGVPEIDALIEHVKRVARAQQRDAHEVEELTRRALAIREEERRNLAHELHDEMGQSISAIKALAVTISRRTEACDPKVKKSADTIAEVSSRVYDRVRQMMSQLRPTMLDELGLVSALADMIDTWNSHHEDVFCGFTPSEPLPPLTATQGINLYRIVQEALTNIAKHAEARHAAVTLECRVLDPAFERELVLCVSDDGRGFDVGAPSRGLGLIGIHERVKALAGKITLASCPGGGTKFEITVPLASVPSSEPHEQDPNSPGG